MLQCPALIDGLNSKGEHILLFLAPTVGRQLIEQEGYTKRCKRPGPTTTTTAYGVPIPEHDIKPPKFARKALDLAIGNGPRFGNRNAWGGSNNNNVFGSGTSATQR
ncbi:unnamed protein product [Meloidogyne enterolobii]|uniref:Uncharacterized protein n=1 Tax=Meloidogyne enterolobii TaxID=390850 RepID=A0ACB1AFI2_MELEN